VTFIGNFVAFEFDCVCSRGPPEEGRGVEFLRKLAICRFANYAEWGALPAAVATMMTAWRFVSVTGLNPMCDMTYSYL